MHGVVAGVFYRSPPSKLHKFALCLACVKIGLVQRGLTVKRGQLVMIRRLLSLRVATAERKKEELDRYPRRRKWGLGALPELLSQA